MGTSVWPQQHPSTWAGLSGGLAASCHWNATQLYSKVLCCLGHLRVESPHPSREDGKTPLFSGCGFQMGADRTDERMGFNLVPRLARDRPVGERERR